MPTVISFTSEERQHVTDVLDAILNTGLPLGKLLVGVFTPAVCCNPAHRALVKDFLSGSFTQDVSTLLDALVQHPDSRKVHIEASEVSAPCHTRSNILSATSRTTAAIASSTPSRLAIETVTLKRASGPPTSSDSTIILGGILTPPSTPDSEEAERTLQVQLSGCTSVASVKITSKHPVDRGASAAVWRGESNGKAVALKVYRMDAVTGDEVLQELIRRELSAWQRLRHPRLLRLLGTSVMNTQPVLVSPYAANGNILQYLQEYPDANRLRLVAEGLVYLHEDAGLVHGDIKGPNILISDTGEALLCDFGLSTLIEKGENDMTTCTDIRMRCTIRFSAPELLDEESFADGDRISAPFGNRVRSKTAKSDVFAFGMVMLQIFTGSAPWDGPDHKVILNIHAGAKPRRPGKAALQRGLSDSVWAICQWCWEYRPAYRPPMQVVTYALGAAAGPVLWTPQTDIVSWIESPSWERQGWTWPLLNGLLSIMTSYPVSDYFTSETVARVLRAILSVKDDNLARLREAFTYFTVILRSEDTFALRLLRQDMLWDTLFVSARDLAPIELLHIADILVSVLQRSLAGDAANARIKWNEHLMAVKQFTDVLFEVNFLAITMSSAAAELAIECDQRLQGLLCSAIPVLAPERWTLIRQETENVLPRLASSRRAGYRRMIETINHALEVKTRPGWHRLIPAVVETRFFYPTEE